MEKKEEDKLNINVRTAGALEIEEFKNKMAHVRKGLSLKKNHKRNQT